MGYSGAADYFANLCLEAQGRTGRTHPQGRSPAASAAHRGNIVYKIRTDALETSLLNQNGYRSYYLLHKNPEWLRQLTDFKKMHLFPYMYPGVIVHALF